MCARTGPEPGCLIGVLPPTHCKQDERKLKIRDSVIVVTGGASGLGLGTARRMVAEGAKVLIADINAEAGEKIAGELGSAVRFARTDVSDERSAQAAFDLARDAFGGLQGLVNCAGIVPAELVLGKRGVH